MNVASNGYDSGATMSTLSQAAGGAENAKCPLLDSGDVVYRHLFQLR